MQYKNLGDTDLRVSELSFGGVEIGMPYGLKMDHNNPMLQERDAIDLLQRSLDSGVNFYDTARLYGRSEEIIGKAFEGKRDQVIYSSKCRHFRQPNGQLIARNEYDSFIRESLNESLEALKTDYIDVFMVHYADLEILELEEVYRTFEDLQQSGLIQYPGISVYKPEETKLAIEKGFWKAIQLPFNLLDQSQSEHFANAKKNGVGIIVRSVLMRGLLTDKSFQLHPALKTVQDHIHLYKELIRGNIDSLSTLATKFAASFDEISSVLVGIDKQEFLIDALKNFDGQYLNEVDLNKAKSLNFQD